MVCIIKIENGAPTSWIIGSDMHDLRRAAQAAGEQQLAEWLYLNEYPRHWRFKLVQ